MGMDLYYMPLSPPCRTVMLLMEELGLSPNMKHVDVMVGEQLKPDFLALNPEHLVPTLVDGDLVLWESRAIATYLVNKYAKDDSLYPKCPVTRAKIDRFLYFDMGTLYQRYADYCYPVAFADPPETAEKPDPAKFARFTEALGWLDKYLAGHDYVVGDSLTVADYSLIASVTSFEAGGIDLSGAPNVASWVQRCRKNMKNFDKICSKGLQDWKEIIEPAMKA